MTSPLENPCGPGQPLRREAPDAKEIAGLEQSGLTRLADAAHALCLAALRRRGYRATNRYIVYQVLPHTLGVGPEVWRVLARCHDLRNRGEYEGDADVDEHLLADLLDACTLVVAALRELSP